MTQKIRISACYLLCEQRSQAMPFTASIQISLLKKGPLFSVGFCDTGRANIHWSPVLILVSRLFTDNSRKICLRLEIVSDVYVISQSLALSVAESIIVAVCCGGLETPLFSLNASGCTMVKCVLNFMSFYTDQQRNSKLVKSLRKDGLAANVYPLMWEL